MSQGCHTVMSGGNKGRMRNEDNAEPGPVFISFKEWIG